MRIVEGGLDTPEVVSLLQSHLDAARAVSPPGSMHALDTSGLRASDMRFWSVWDGETLLGVGALRLLDPRHGEIKSMHTSAAARRRGVGRAIVGHIIALSREQPYGSYKPDANSAFYTLVLEPRTQVVPPKEGSQHHAHQ
jgi:putative acetyltransferase